MRDAAVRRPKCEAVVERIRILVLKLHRPRGPAVRRLIDAKICWICSNRHQIRNTGAERLHIAELQRFGARHYTSVPSLSAVGRDGERTVAAARPDHLWVHRPDRDQTISGAAVLRSKRGLMKMS